jgi:hypothetical protein
VPVSGDTVVLGTHEARLHDGHVQLAPLSGALVS